MTTENTKKTATDLLTEEAQKQLDGHEIVNHFQTAVHEGRHVTAILMADQSLFIRQTSFHVPGNEPTEMHLSPETFSFLLETFLRAEEEFKINRKKNLEKLTAGTGKIQFKKTLSLNSFK